MSAEIGVYNPDDEELEFRFNGLDYKLAPEDITMIPRAAVGPMLSQVGEYGVSVVPVGLSKKDLGALAKESKERWLVGTRKWAEDVLLSSRKANKERIEAGIAPIEGPQVEQARAWLKKFGFLASLVLCLLLPSTALAQWTTIAQKVGYGIYAKDVTGASYTYCKLVGYGGDPFARGNEGRGRIKTTGASTTVDEATAGENPFTEVAVGDMILVQIGSTVYRRAVTARASAAQITVDSNITLTGNAWTWYRQQCGTGAEDGWLDASRFYQLNVVYQVDTINATSIDRSLECRLGGGTATVVADATSGGSWTVMTSAKNYSDVILGGVWEACRIGLKINTDTGAQKVTVYYGLQQ